MRPSEYLAQVEPFKEPWWQELQRTLPTLAKRIAWERLGDMPEWLQIELRREAVRTGAI